MGRKFGGNVHRIGAIILTLLLIFAGINSNAGIGFFQRMTVLVASIPVVVNSLEVRLFAWVSGSNLSPGGKGIYGTIGVGSTLNIPGSRINAISWIDSANNLWLFGGNGLDSAGTSGYLNDLWKFNYTTLEWTWVSGSNLANQTATYGSKGVASTAYIPGGRSSSISWIDGSGQLWLFGGYSSLSGYFNDLWMFNPSTLEWTWVSGSNLASQVGTYGTKGTGSTANIPGGRYRSISWIDSSGNLWLFGGYGYGSAFTLSRLNDLWKFEPTTLNWTWVAGSNVVNQGGTYGVKGTGATTNIPGARYFSVSWTDNSGNFWLFGGVGYDGAGTVNNLSDLWKFNSLNSEWTWVSGPNVAGQVGTYGSRGYASATSIPGGRQSAMSWKDKSGNFWIFGGSGKDSASASGRLNELWKFNISTSEWTWVAGANTISQPGTYGTLGVSDINNIPSSRTDAVSWVDSAGDFWMFAGSSISFSTNDLWRISTLPTQPPAKFVWAGSSSITAGQCSTLQVIQKDSTDNLTAPTTATPLALAGNGAGTFYSDATCSTPTTSLTIAGGSYFQNVYFKSTIEESLTLTASATGLTAGTLAVQILIVPSSTYSTISTSPASVSADGMTTANVTVTLRDASNLPIAGKNVQIAATGTGNIITQPFLPTDSNGQTTATISSTNPQIKTLSIFSPAVLGVSATVTFAPLQQLILAGTSPVLKTTCAAYNISTQNMSGTPINVSSDTTINLSSAGGGTFYSDASCTLIITSTTIAANTGSTSVYFKGTTGGTFNLTASEATFGSGILNLQIQQTCQKILNTAGLSTWTVPSDWNNSNNTIEVIGGGAGGGCGGSVTTSSGAGGGGGGYSKISNAQLIGTSVTYSVGAGGTGGSMNSVTTLIQPTAGGATWFCSSTTGCASGNDVSVVVSASGGSGGSAATSGLGGSALVGIGFSGGTGPQAGCQVAGGGGGAAGPHGAGITPSGISTCKNGGAGDAGNVLAWGTVGSGSGGNGGGSPGTAYGGGGGGGLIKSNYPRNPGGAGASGLIVVTYLGTACN